MPNWREILQQVEAEKADHEQKAQQALDQVRRQYLAKLHEATGRNVIAYYSGWLSKPNIAQTEISDEDKNGIMMAVHNLDRTKGLDLILHTPGGGLAATESIVNYLRQMFNRDIRAVVPQIAMSAGTIIACCCKEILLSKHSNLGPIDPLVGGLPAYGMIEEFQRAFKEIKKDSAKISVWGPILSKYPPTILSQCENAIEWSKSFVEQELQYAMFFKTKNKQERAEKVVKALSDYRQNKTHSRHIHFDECRKIGLKVELIEDSPDLQDLVLTVHHCYMHALQNTSSYKITENHLGVALVKQQRDQTQLIRFPVNQ